MEEGLQIQLSAHELGTFFGISITNALFTAWVVMALLIALGYFVGRNPKLIPGKLQTVFEWIFETVFGYMEEMLGSKKLAERYFPLIMTIFLFIFVANEMEFLPIFGSVGLQDHGEFVPLFHAATADLNFPLALATISFFVIEISGIVTLGFLKYGSKFVNFHGGAMGFAVGLLELIGNLARLISFSFRLFGSIFAGEVLLLVIGAFVPLLLPIPLMAFEAFIGLLQAAIFAILTLAFIKIAIAEPHREEAHASH